MNAFHVLIGTFLCMWFGLVEAQDEFLNRTQAVVVDRGGNDVTKVGHKFVFPDQLNVDIVLENEIVVEVRAPKVHHVIPHQAVDSNGVKTSNIDEFYRKGFYVDHTGSFILRAMEADGIITTKLTGRFKFTMDNLEVTCLLMMDGCVCQDMDDYGGCDALPIPPGVMEESFTYEDRQRRQVGVSYTDFSYSAGLRVAYLMDKSFLDLFISLTNSTAEAVDLAMDYFIALNNEVTYMYQSIKEQTDGQTEITLYKAGLHYPAVGTDYPFVTQHVTGNQYAVAGQGPDGITDFGTWVAAGNLDDLRPFDVAILYTRLDIGIRAFRRIITGSVGIAYTGTTCLPYDNLKVAIVEDRIANTAWTTAHEIGHGLSARHDRTGNPCRPNRNLMSANQFTVTATTQNTWNRFSSCSINYFVNYLRNHNCPFGGGYTQEQFYDQLCAGSRGEYFDIHQQCKLTTGNPSSTACLPVSLSFNGGKVPANACYRSESVRCTTFAGCRRSIFMVFDGTPCVGRTTDDHICYRGDCVRKVDICSSMSCSNPCGWVRTRIRLLWCCSRRAVNPNSCCGSCMIVRNKCRPAYRHWCACEDY